MATPMKPKAGRAADWLWEHCFSKGEAGKSA